MKKTTSAANTCNKWFAFVAESRSLKSQNNLCIDKTNVAFGPVDKTTAVNARLNESVGQEQINHISNDPSIPGSFSFLPPGSSSKTFFMKQILLRFQIALNFLLGFANSF